MVDVPTRNRVIEETQMDHNRSVCTKQRRCFMCLTLLRSFLDLLIHFTTRSLQFARARLQIDTDAEMRKWGIPLVFLGK